MTVAPSPLLVPRTSAGTPPRGWIESPSFDLALFVLSPLAGLLFLAFALGVPAEYAFLVQAAAPVPVSDRERAQRARASQLLEDSFEQVPVDVSVRCRTTRISPGALGGLAVGDVVRLTHPAAAPLDVTVGGATFAHATAGTHGRRVAALIVGTPAAPGSTRGTTKEKP